MTLALILGQLLHPQARTGRDNCIVASMVRRPSSEMFGPRTPARVTSTPLVLLFRQSSYFRQGIWA
jgi:hypothetical protein